jgi:hypothetical protein
MIDPAFLPFSEALAALLDFPGSLVDNDAGVRAHIYECTIELPMEIGVSRGADGSLELGSAPPLYYVATTFRPSYHRVRFTATRSEGSADVR